MFCDPAARQVLMNFHPTLSTFARSRTWPRYIRPVTINVISFTPLRNHDCRLRRAQRSVKYIKPRNTLNFERQRDTRCENCRRVFNKWAPSFPLQPERNFSQERNLISAVVLSIPFPLSRARIPPAVLSRAWVFDRRVAGTWGFPRPPGVKFHADF